MSLQEQKSSSAIEDLRLKFLAFTYIIGSGNHIRVPTQSVKMHNENDSS
jgi:hypothetical protein